MSTSGKAQGNDTVAQNTYVDRLAPVKQLVGYINDDYLKQSLDETVTALHSLWAKCIEAAIAIPADDPAQHTLFEEMQGLGTSGSLCSDDTPRFGVLWFSYPLLAKDILNATLDAMKDVKKQDLLNLATFTANLMGKYDLDDNELLMCALVVLRKTLEERRPLKMEENGTDTPVADLLPATVAWFKFAGCKFVEFSVDEITGSEKNDEIENMLVVLGDLAHDGSVPTLGFSLERWQFWEQRLEQLSSVDDKEIRDQALIGKEAMRKGREEWDKKSGDLMER